ncbi:DUF6786 family protein [Tamlana sp. 2201CG12-4]|uniref:DUF6786 family protein n=1 Tax=Tamlana sp. 2201CG12-4 TaxID=3112582 RepID=UPI002DB59DCF|nr:DUF6786 family protein [Tamlana sp. 2201CG12-4]MEC3908240.1 DUF6786 family protein [Tamlana sp. 2201CG12-4]
MKLTFKTKQRTAFVALLFTVLLEGCKDNKKEPSQADQKEVITGPFKEDVDFMKQYEKDLIVLQSGKSMIAVAPRLQGRVMTSSSDGMAGASYGWINKVHYKSGEINPQINVYGGEERFWLGPEGGQYSIYFKKGKDFTFENWATPKLIDLEPFDVLEQTTDKVSFTKSAALTNYAGFTFNFQINRDVTIISNNTIVSQLGVASIGDVKAVGYKTENTLKNIDDKAWTKDNGLLSIWMLGMYKHSETTTVVMPYKTGNDNDLGKPVNIYESFGALDEERLIAKEGVIYFKGDGKHRSKIGLSPERAKDIAGSYDAQNGVLTIVKYNKPDGVSDYVNSKWELQEFPYGGDAVNSYNDGPTPSGEPLGPFYELETSSPAAALQPDEAITHTQYTFHFEGNETALNQISEATLGVSLEEIKNVFK